MRLRPAAVAAGACALALATPASGALPEYDGGPVVHREEPATFVLPLRGPLYERFGYDRGRLHAGIDIAVLGTDAVRAALPGVVTAVGYLDGYSGYGNVVRIRHARGIQTMYAHLARAAVRVGETVDRGEVIARAGCTGSCTGPHVHFEVRVRGKLADPLAFFPRGLR